MTDHADRLADFLETVATKVRALTVDRANKAIVVVSLGLPALILVVVAIVFLFMTIHEALAIPLGDAAGFGIVAGLFALGGLLAWKKRLEEPK